jgi:putative phosphoribosyl transferase
MRHDRDVEVIAGNKRLDGSLTVPERATGAVAFAHGSGSSRFSPRNRAVAAALNDAGFATLLLDLLTPDEERVDAYTGHLRFDVGLLAQRLVAATDWLAREPATADLPIGYFGASTGAAAALIAAAERPGVTAVVSRGGRPDLAGRALAFVRAPTLLIVGGADVPVIELNRRAQAQMCADVETRIEIVPGATHLFEEPGALEKVAHLATEWFRRHTRRAESAA